MPRTCRQRETGLTLIEMLVVVAITTVVFIAVTGGIAFFYRTNAYGIEQTFAIASARRGVSDMVEVIREATFSDTGAFPIVSMSANDLILYSDTDSDNSVERVEYHINGVELQKTTINASGNPPSYTGAGSVEVVADDVRNLTQGVPVFTYFDSDGAEIVDYSEVAHVAFVRLNVIVNVNPNRLPNEFTLRSSARLRNISFQE